MNKTLSLCLVSAGLMLSFSASADPSLARFDGGIGSQQLRAGALVNDVFGVPPGGRPWVIDRLTADVRTNGKIRVDGRGLVLGGGNNVGTSGGQSVRARLFCGGVPHDSTTLVLLEPNGDFRIDDQLVPTPPSACANPVLLIISGGGSWVAAGSPKQ